MRSPAVRAKRPLLKFTKSMKTHNGLAVPLFVLSIASTTAAMRKLLRVPLLMVALLVGTSIAQAQQVPDPRVADLARAGKIRVALFPWMYTKDPATGELRGIERGVVLEEANASGLVQRAIDRAGLRGVQVPPPAKPEVEK
jgi:hypothetical protein